MSVWAALRFLCDRCLSAVRGSCGSAVIAGLLLVILLRTRARESVRMRTGQKCGSMRMFLQYMTPVAFCRWPVADRVKVRRDGVCI